MQLEEKILNLRKTNGVSQEDLAELMGVSRQTVSKWETGSAQPSSANLEVLCEVFSVDKSYFFEEAICKVEDDTTDIKEIVTEVVHTRERRKNIIRYSVCLPVLAVVLTIMVIVTVWFGYASALIEGAQVSASNYEITYEAFIFMLIATVTVFFIEAVLIILLIINIMNKREVKK